MTRSIPATGTITAFLIVATAPTPAVGAERCNPPHQECGQAPLTYACPPCPPGVIKDVSASELESYRRSLEAYREKAEEKRTDNPGGSLVRYDKAITKYQQGISNYKDAITTIGKPPE